MPSALPASLDIQKRLQELVGSRYEIVREIGRGGMAIVFQAHDLPGHRQVAIKVLLPQIAIVIGARRFQQEISILRQLQHPCILPVLESAASGVEEELQQGSPLLYFVMPYAEGETLRACIEREAPLPIDRVRAITRDLASAIDYAHKRGIIHRDIKPENIMLTAERALITDFGVARAVVAAGEESFSSSGLVLGTPAYMSPEQALGAKVDYRTDIYALGCVVYEMLSGERPFTGSTAQAIIARQVGEGPRSLRVVRPSLPKEIEAAVLAALAKNPRHRPQSGLAFLTALGG